MLVGDAAYGRSTGIRIAATIFTSNERFLCQLGHSLDCAASKDLQEGSLVQQAQSVAEGWKRTLENGVWRARRMLAMRLSVGVSRLQILEGKPTIQLTRYM